MPVDKTSEQKRLFCFPFLNILNLSEPSFMRGLKTKTRSLTRANVGGLSKVLAEREGFEPPELAFNGFQDRLVKPL